nr:hypothetical protein BaRGS_028038 [Batillaria attramentaria]
MREQLRLEQEKSEERLNALMRRYEEEKRAEQEKVMTFVLRLEEQHRQLLSLCRVELDGEKLRDLVERLFQNFDIRLLGVDCGLTFLMAAPAEQWVTVVERQMEIEATLRGFLPQGQLQEVTWEQPAPVDCGPSCDDVDLQLGQPLPVQV